MKSKTKRKNRFRKIKKARRALILRRTVFAVKGFFWVLALVAFSTAFIFAYDCFTQTDHFQARRITVIGATHLDHQQVLAFAGIEPRVNILSVNLSRTRKRLMAHPWIADVKISRDIPSNLTIQIREQAPLALLDMGNTRGFLINNDGEVFKREDPANGMTIPRVQGLVDTDLPVAGKPDTAAFRAVMDIFTIAREKNSALPLHRIRWIRMDREIGATVYVGKDNRAIKLGFGRYREKCEALAYLIARLNGDHRLAQYRIIDLFDVNRIVITLAPADPSGLDHEEV